MVNKNNNDVVNDYKNDIDINNNVYWEQLITIKYNSKQKKYLKIIKSFF